MYNIFALMGFAVIGYAGRLKTREWITRHPCYSVARCPLPRFQRPRGVSRYSILKLLIAV